MLKKLRDKAKLLEKLGGEIPTELQKIIEDESRSKMSSPRYMEESSKDSRSTETNIDDLLEEIEKKELPKIKTKSGKIDMFSSNPSSQVSSAKNSPRSNGDRTPPLDEIMKPLFPSSKAISEEPPALFPSSVNIEENGIDPGSKVEVKPETLVTEKKGTNLYMMDANEPIENKGRKKLRISNSVLPDRKKSEMPVYTTKYSQVIEGFSGERTGLGFSKDDEGGGSPKNTVSYGNGLVFTKGEVLNEDKKDEDLDDLTDLVESKLKYLNSLQTTVISPVQEMLIQLQVSLK